MRRVETEDSDSPIATREGGKTRHGINTTGVPHSNEPEYEVNYESLDTTPNELSSVILNLDNRLDQEGLSDVKIVSP